MTLPRGLLHAIAATVEREGGTMDDVDDLVDSWTRMLRATGPLADAIHRQAREARCCCADGGDGEHERCERCWGLRPQPQQDE